jgi:hypothetical protein
MQDKVMNDDDFRSQVDTKKGQAPHSTQPLRMPLLPSGPDGVLPIVVAWDPTLDYHYSQTATLDQRIFTFIFSLLDQRSFPFAFCQ